MVLGKHQFGSRWVILSINMETVDVAVNDGKWNLTPGFCLYQEVISLSEGSTVDLRNPGGEEEDTLLTGDNMEPEECFPDCK